MRYEIRTLGENGSVRIGTVHLSGEFGFNDGSAFWNACEPEKQHCQVYYFDLTEVSALPPDGLVWLKVFLCWARESGRSVRFTNTPAPLQGLLAAAGIFAEGTASARAEQRSHRTDDLDPAPSDREELAQTLRSDAKSAMMRYG